MQKQSWFEVPSDKKKMEVQMMEWEQNETVKTFAKSLTKQALHDIAWKCCDKIKEKELKQKIK